MPPGQSKSVRFDRPGIVRVFCEIHSHMSAFILVFSHPFFAMTDSEGRYRIDNVPPGTYTVVAWNEGDVVGSDAGDGAERRRRRAGFHRCDDDLLLAAQPHLSGERLLAVLSIGVAHLLVNVPRDAGGRARAAARDRRDRRRWSISCARRGPQTFTHDGAADRRHAASSRRRVDTNDPPTVQDVAERLSAKQLNSNLLLVTNKTGRVLAIVGASPRAADDRREPAGGPRRARRPRKREPAAAVRTACCSS